MIQKEAENYKQYLAKQIVRAESKWARKYYYNEIFKKNLNESWKQVKDEIGDPKSICCMGVRDGTEAFEFKSYYPKADVYGVDITENIKSIKTHVDVKIRLHDFNDLPKDWENKFDLIFSNSIDHAYKPEDTIKEWHRVSKNGGYLFLEFSTTRPNNIEHSFNLADIDSLFPDEMFKQVKVWEIPRRNVIAGLFEVIK